VDFYQLFYDFYQSIFGVWRRVEPV